MAQSGGPQKAAPPANNRSSEPSTGANAPLTNGGLLPAPSASNGTDQGSQDPAGESSSDGLGPLARSNRTTATSSTLQCDDPIIDPEKKRNTSFKITVLPSRPPSNDPVDDGSGDDDVEDSKTEDISDGKDNSAAVPTTTSEQPQGAAVDQSDGAIVSGAASANPVEGVGSSQATGSSTAANASTAPPQPSLKRKTSTTSNAGAPQRDGNDKSRTGLPFTMGYTFNIFVYNSSHPEGKKAGNDVRPPSAKVQASAASAYVSDIDVGGGDADGSATTEATPPPSAVNILSTFHVSATTPTTAGAGAETPAKQSGGGVSKSSKLTNVSGGGSVTKSGKTYAAAASSGASSPSISEAQLLAMLTSNNQSPKHGPQDRFKFVKIQTTPSKTVGRWTLVDFSNRSGPLAPPPQPFPSTTSPAISMTAMQHKLKTANATPAAETPAAESSAAVQLPSAPPQSVALPPAPHQSLANVPQPTVTAPPVVSDFKPLPIVAPTGLTQQQQLSTASTPAAKQAVDKVHVDSSQLAPGATNASLSDIEASQNHQRPQQLGPSPVAEAASSNLSSDHQLVPPQSSASSELLPSHPSPSAAAAVSMAVTPSSVTCLPPPPVVSPGVAATTTSAAAASNTFTSSSTPGSASQPAPSPIDHQPQQLSSSLIASSSASASSTSQSQYIHPPMVEPAAQVVATSSAQSTSTSYIPLQQQQPTAVSHVTTTLPPQPQQPLQRRDTLESIDPTAIRLLQQQQQQLVPGQQLPVASSTAITSPQPYQQTQPRASDTSPAAATAAAATASDLTASAAGSGHSISSARSPSSIPPSGGGGGGGSGGELVTSSTAAPISPSPAPPAAAAAAAAATAAAPVKAVQQPPPPIDRSGQHLLVLDKLLGGVASGTSVLPTPAKGGNLGGSKGGSVAAVTSTSALPSWPPIVGEEMVRKLQEISANQQSASASLAAGNELDPESASGTNQGAIDNRIERAMDLVKSHLMNAVRSEVEELKDKIKIMEATICNLQTENEVLKRHVPTETLLQITTSQQSSLPALTSEVITPGPASPAAPNVSSQQQSPPSVTSSATLPSGVAGAGGGSSSLSTTSADLVGSLSPLAPSASSGCGSVPSASPPPQQVVAAPAVATQQTAAAAPTPPPPSDSSMQQPQQPQQ